MTLTRAELVSAYRPEHRADLDAYLAAVEAVYGGPLPPHRLHEAEDAYCCDPRPTPNDLVVRIRYEQACRKADRNA